MARARWIVWLCVVPLLNASALAQRSLDSVRARISQARSRIEAQTKLYRDPVGPCTWIDGSKLWYCETAADGERRWWLVDARAAGKSPLFNHEEASFFVAPPVNGAFVSPARLPVQGVVVEGGMVIVSFEKVDHPMVFDLATGRLSAQSADASAQALKTLELQLKPGIARSRGQGPSSGIHFANHLDEPVELFWIDGSGHERSYGRVAPHAEHTQHTFSGHAWVIKTVNGEVLGHVVAVDIEKTAVIERAAVAQREQPKEKHGASPASPLEVAHDGANLVIRLEGRELLRTTDGSESDGYFGGHWISPAHDAVIAMKVKRGQRHPVHLVEAAPKDHLEPSLKTIDYTKPGDEIDLRVPHLFRIERATDGPAATVVREVSVDTALLSNPWSLDGAHFLGGGKELCFLYNQRGHQVVRLIAIDLASGSVRTVAEQSYPTFVDWTNKVWVHWLDATGELLWMTERTGSSQIELIDAATGVMKRAVTAGPWLVRSVHAVNDSARTIDVAIRGVANQDPYHEHHARVSLDTDAVTMLTSGNGTCEVKFSVDRTAYLCVRSRADIPPVHELRRASDGAVVQELGAGDARAMRAAGWIAPEPFVAKGRDGRTDIWGLVYRPTGYDATKSYPIIENIYAGPHDQHVPKAFDLTSRSREYAELGAIVVQIDGMGTNWRGKAFHDVCWKNLKDAGFPDRIAWIRELAARDSAVDLTRVGIFGGSAGGQSAMRALLDHWDFYTVAVADCGCHDNRMDKIWWNEQWLGWPIDESYAANSNAADAAKLGGALMLMVGALDENVDPSSTMQVAQKLIEAGKDFELLVFPRSGHGSAESEYGNARRAQFLFEHLETPRKTTSDR